MAIMRQQARFIEQLYSTGMVDDQEVTASLRAFLFQGNRLPHDCSRILTTLFVDPAGSAYMGQAA